MALCIPVMHAPVLSFFRCPNASLRQQSSYIKISLATIRISLLRNRENPLESYGVSLALKMMASRVSAAAAKHSVEHEEGTWTTCLRCGQEYNVEDNSPTACSYHGHMTGDRGLFALAPPHQGVDGEWSEASGVIVYKWAEEGERPNTGRQNWQRRWSCCGVYGEHASPCRTGWHVSYDDGATRFD